MNKSGGVYRIGTGATSLMMILVILCLTALSVISYTSARSELAVARRTAEVNSQVYAAMDRGYDLVAALDAALWDIYGRGDAKAYAQACQDAARQAGWTVEDSVCTVEIPATEKLSLRVQGNAPALHRGSGTPAAYGLCHRIPERRNGGILLIALDQILSKIMQESGSDIYILPGTPVKAKVRGQMEQLGENGAPCRTARTCSTRSMPWREGVP